MKNIRLLFVAALCIMLISPVLSYARSVSGGIYYTRANIWYTNPRTMASTNYHMGDVLPIGTKVKMLKKVKGKFVFQDCADGVRYTYMQAIPHTKIDSQDLFKRYFSKNNILESKEYKSLSDVEKANIETGTVEEGMSKKAVIMAYGYPPSHRTLSTSSNEWLYWISRRKTMTVTFNNFKVTDVG